ncbi:hypothetical protein AC579_8574 [Pseudocercospora musae]|uniref:Uncharacterized protein n=1 Tax=Pseudocercospora musae TaxID=113226 RepID=A0A139IB05_9PEZI|nr:hypothetical protein AC579_8574 [Pseudocercospora musae]
MRSIVGLLLGGGGSWYKAGVTGYTIKTPRTADLMEKGRSDSILERNFGKPEEVANAIMVSISPAASHINGHMLDGGLSIAD